MIVAAVMTPSSPVQLHRRRAGGGALPAPLRRERPLLAARGDVRAAGRGGHGGAAGDGDHAADAVAAALQLHAGRGPRAGHQDGRGQAAAGPRWAATALSHSDNTKLLSLKLSDKNFKLSD